MNTFEKNILSIYGESGRQWLRELPQQVAQLESLWGLSYLQPYCNLSFHYILFGYQQSLPIVLKLGPDARSLDKESRALEAFAGYGGISILARTKNAILLQRAMPGISLKGHPKALEIACRVVEKLHLAPFPIQDRFPHIDDWLAALDKEWDIPKLHLEKARELKNRLLKTDTIPVLLHGDLHQDNILSNGEDWLVIDPKGVIGFPINELWACVENPSHDLAYLSKHFHYPFDYVAGWYYVHLILAACWRVEDHLDPRLFLELAQSVTPMMNKNPIS